MIGHATWFFRTTLVAPIGRVPGGDSRLVMTKRDARIPWSDVPEPIADNEAGIGDGSNWLDARHADRLRSLRRWRSWQGFGGFVLATSCFLPAIDACGSPFVPAREIWDGLSSASMSYRDWTGPLWIGLPYLIGLTIVITALRGRECCAERERTRGRWLAVLLAVWAGVLLLTMLGELRIPKPGQTNPPIWHLNELMFAIASVLSLIHVCRGLRRGRSGLLCVRWYAGFCCLIWFSWWFGMSLYTDERTYYGIWLSMASSALIAWATYAEARLVSYQGRRATLSRLLTCSLTVYDIDEPRCARCGYLLHGLPSNRCPECGTLNDVPPSTR